MANKDCNFDRQQLIILVISDCPFPFSTQAVLILPMLTRTFAFKSIATFLLLELMLLGGCSDAKSTQSVQKQSETAGKTAETPSINPTQKTPESASTATQIQGKWNPVAFIAPDGQPMDLSQLSEAERNALSWEFTPDGMVKFADRKGQFKLDGSRMSVTNLNTGNVSEYEFSLSETELTIVNTDRATFKLKKGPS